jgi:4-aminobutyrate aminotransferase-like enzyme
LAGVGDNLRHFVFDADMPTLNAGQNNDLPPHVPLQRIREVLASRYGLDGDLAPLDGERDQNHHLSTPRGRFVVKLCNISEGAGLVHAQALALQHVARVAPELKVPRVLPSKAGNVLEDLVENGQHYPLLVLGWLQGDVVGERNLSPDQYRDLGSTIGQLNRAFRGFSHAAITSRELSWNTARFNPSEEDLARLAQHDILRIGQIHAAHSARIAPVLEKQPAQVLHGDVHPFNTLLDAQGAIAGIIDFGDLIHGPRLLDLSNALADCLLPGQDMEHIMHSMIAGFVRHVPLEEQEVDVLLPLMRARLALTALITARRRAAGAAVTPQIAALDSISLDVLRQLDGDSLQPTIRYAANFSPRRQTVAQGILDRRIQAMGPKPLLFYDQPLHIVAGEGVWLTAADGRRYLDCYNNVPHVGHANPQVAEAVARQMRTLNTNTRYLTEQAIAYAERLKATLDPSLDTVIFVNSGSEANDVAYRMARCWTGHSGMLVMENAYHGVTDVSDAMSPSNYPHGRYDKPHVRQMEAPDTYRGRFRADCQDGAERYAALTEEQIRELAEHGHGVAVCIIDSAFMTNGIIDAPAGYVREIAARTRQAGGLLVADEVQSGFGRMGTHMWGHQHHGVIPDMVTIGKPAGNGYPIGAIITRAEVLARFTAESGPFFSTFGGGNAACAAAIAVLDVMDQESLVSNSHVVGKYLRDGLRGLMAKHPLIGDVRGAGLAVGVDLVRDRSTRHPATGETRRVINALCDEGVLLGSDGKAGNVLKIRPPIVFTPAHADIAIAALDRVLSR